MAVDKTESALVAAASVSDLDVGRNIDTSSEFACERASTEAYASVDAGGFVLSRTSCLRLQSLLVRKKPELLARDKRELPANRMPVNQNCTRNHE